MNYIFIKPLLLNLIMPLVSSEIIKHIVIGDIIIVPYRKQQLNNASYNVTIGEDYYVQRSETCTINPFNKDDIANMWIHRNASDGFITISPRESVLCHTKEFIGSVAGSVPMLKSRSSMMRSCLSIAGGAGWGDVGFTSRWAFTIHNNGVNEVKIPVGSEVAQIIFMKVKFVTDSYNGSYQDDSEDFDEHMAKWHHSCILPKPTNS